MKEDGTYLTSSPAAAKGVPGISPDRRRTRGRPAREEAALITQQIMNAAREIFQEQSFEEASLEVIAARAGVERNTIYKRYPDKRALLRAVLSGQLATWALESNALPESGTLEEQLQFYAVQLLRRGLSPRVRHWNRMAESAWPGIDQLRERRTAMGYDKAVELFTSLVQEGGAKEGRSPSHPEFVANAFMSILAGWTDSVGYSPHISDEEIVDFARASAGLLIRGYASW